MPDSLREFIEKVKVQADIVQVVSQYVPLKKSGPRYLGLCPFHNDRSPSMNVNPRIGIFKCFACGSGGDVIRFVQDYEKIGFLDALKIVANKAGLALPDEKQWAGDARQAEKSSRLLKANALAADFYERHLVRSREALDYLDGRGLKPETRQRFRLGFAPEDPSELLRMGERAGLKDHDFVEAGILSESVSRPLDRFRHRLIFPIWNLSGNIVGLAGRVLVKDQQPKYLNSPETAVYHKSRILYGLHLARAPMDKSGEVVLVEGYMDALSLHEAGFPNVVAVSGTALTREHVRVLSRFAKKAILFFDGDEAGQKAVSRSLEPLLEAGMEIRIPKIPKEEDPDSFARKYGREKLEEVFAQSENLVDFLTRPLAKNPRGLSPEEKDLLLREAVDLVTRIPSALVRSEYLERLGARFGTTALPALAEANSLSRPASRNSGPRDSGPASENSGRPAPAEGEVPNLLPAETRERYRKSPEGQLLQHLFSSPDLCRRALQDLDLEWLHIDALRELTDSLLLHLEAGGEDIFDLKGFVEILSDADKEIVLALGFLEGLDADVLAKGFFEILMALEIRHLQKQLRSETDLRKAAPLRQRLQEINQQKAKGGNP